MSIDMHLQIDTGKGMKRVVEIGNYTHNCQGMWSLALSEASKSVDITDLNISEISMCNLDGLFAARVYPLLRTALDHMDNPENRSTYVAMNPSNNWGDFDSAREYFRTLVQACYENPLCFIYAGC